MKKKITAITLIIMSTILLCSCSSDKDDSKSKSEATTAAESSEVATTEVATTEEITEKTETKTETKKNSVDASEWPDLAKADIDDATIIKIYEDFEEAFKKSYDDVNEQEAYEKKVTKEIAEKYGVSEDIASSAYGYAVMNYDSLLKNGESKKDEYKLMFGELLEKNTTGKTVVIKAKIEPNLTNKQTIDQNYYNVGDLIKNQGLDEYEEIQYWAVADMKDGSESKVISFTVPKSVIKKVKDGSIVDNQLGDHVDDLWILPSLNR